MNNLLRLSVRGAYDIQKLRTQMGNRIVGNFKVKLGQKPGTKEDEIDAEGRRILNDLRVRYRRLTDGVKTFPRERLFKGDGVIDTYTELRLVHHYVELRAAEDGMFKTIGLALKQYPIWRAFLEGIKGVGPAMAGVIISEIDISKAKYSSSLWKYAGLDVAGDGAGRSRRKEHLVEREYENKDGEKALRKGITFNPFLKTKLIGVLGGSFLRAGDNKYSRIYRDYKTRLENHSKHKDKSKGWRHNMATRYMIKQFLVDLYTAWRELEGLPVAPPYAEEKLGIEHRKAV